MGPIEKDLSVLRVIDSEFQRDVLGKLGRLETKMDSLAGNGQPASAPGGQVALSPEVKQAIAEQVKAQIAASQAEAGKTGSSDGGQQAASGEVPPALDPARRTFVVSDDLAVVADGDAGQVRLAGHQCSLTAHE